MANLNRTLTRGQHLGIALILLFIGSFLTIAIYGALRGDTVAASHISAVPSSEMQAQPLAPKS
ncbi:MULTISPECIES: hypothetical protein [unclassified Acidiphilium]|nr:MULTISPECIES: hypothetical protein [unclassified Acidiphilium]MCW8309140.1 hypothetical protein [Acidiphilium sp. PA]